MDVAADTIVRWRRDPVSFVVDNFGVTPDVWQAEALEALGGEAVARRRVAMKACTGPGKSAVLAWAGWHRLSCFAGRGEHPKGAALSGEGRDNLTDNLWAELSKWQQRSQFLMSAFTWHKERIVCNAHHETWFLSARSYPNDADTEAIGRSLSGLHSQFPFVLLDETGAMPVAVGQKAEQIFTGGVIDGLVIQAGNPTTTEGLLYHVCTVGRDQWSIITITADPDDVRRTPRVDIEHAREMIARYGRDNPWVMATILGLFPPSGLNTLLGVDEIEEAMRRNITPDKYEFSQKRLGIDVARFGDDKTVIFPRQGLQAFKPAEMRNARSNEIAARVMSAKLKWDSEIEFIDDTGGYGSGVIDAMLQGGASPVGIHFAGKAVDARYLNKRAEMWFLMAEWIKRGGGLPKVPELVGELTTPTYTFRNGKFQIEEKDQIKDRLGRSPDYADALALTFGLPEMPGEIRLPGVDMGRGKIKYEYDPLAGGENG